MVVADSHLPNSAFAHKDFNSIRNTVGVPNLVNIQLNSFEWFKTNGLVDLLKEITPIEDFNGGRFELHFLNHEIRDPKHSERECRQREITFSAPLYVTRSTGHQGHRRGQGTDPVLRRRTDDDAQRDLRHQRRGAGCGVPVGALTRRLLHHGDRPGVRPRSLHGQVDSLPRRVGRTGNVQPGPPLGQG